MRDWRWHRTAVSPRLAGGDVTLSNSVQRTIGVEDLQVVRSSCHVLVEPCETSDRAPAIGSDGKADSPQQLLDKRGQAIGEGWCGRAIMIRLAQGWVHLMWAIGDANSVRSVHGAIQHTDLVDDGTLQMRVFLHQHHTFVQLVLEAIVSRFSAAKAIIGIEVPAKVRWATTRNIRAPGASTSEELVNIVEAHSHKRCGLVPVSFGSCNCGCLPPLADLHVSALWNVPASWQRLRMINSMNGPISTSCGMAVTPAIAVSRRIWL